MFHKIKNVCAMPDYQLCVQFSEDVTKIYDVKPLFAKWPVFKALEEDTKLFYNVVVDKGGYGIVWNDDLDLSCNELYENGNVIIPNRFGRLMTIKDAIQLRQQLNNNSRNATDYKQLLEQLLDRTDDIQNIIMNCTSSQKINGEDHVDTQSSQNSEVTN